MSMALVEFVDFSFKYLGADSLALKRISLRINPGEYVVVTGPSGCGKTTLCRAINGLVPHFHRGYIGGHVFVDSKDTRENEVSQLANVVGLVFQDPVNQLVTLNVERELAFGPENLGVEADEIRQRVEELIARLDLEGLRRKHPHEMSGGEQQRVALAAVLALNPKVLVADEPTSNLDPKSAELILGLVAELNRQGMTIVLVEHRLDLVSKDATRMILMDKGSIVADGPPRDILIMNLCQEIGVGIPKATQVYKRLASRGVQLPWVPLTGEELAAAVAEAR
ncbi:MAG: energy-coupling factor ABC transporter ATP-binding protein [Candidatus Thorarchaeota archaeon]|nr:MAG: energy-coupling factor ABC transporter ATP-binding protein [Candidatus Thorarchaeota archaeon]